MEGTPFQSHRWVGIALALVAGCSKASTYTEPPPPGPGVVYTFPEDAQRDVPVGTALIVRFSDPLSSSPTGACLAKGDGGVQGDVCLIGPGGPVATTLSVAGQSNQILALHPASPLSAGASYSVVVDPSVLGGSTNIPAGAPLFTFTTRQEAIQAGSAAVVVSINDDDPAVFQPEGPTPRSPFTTFASIRLVFSEPVDEATFVLGQTLRFAVVAADGSLSDVPGNLLVGGIHLTFDPDNDLDPSASYQLILGEGLLDEGGEPLQVPATYTFAPLAASASGKLFPQILTVEPPGSASGPSSTASTLSGAPDNSIAVQSVLIGQPLLSSTAGAIESDLADPSAFGGPIPLTIRKGQRLDLSPLPLAFGGSLPTPYQTGAMHMVFLTDANGVIRRNPYRPASTSPDDARSPVFVEFTFDAAMFADDAQGNVVSTQTLYAVHLAGLSTTDGSQLAIETLGALEFNALGAEQAQGNASFRLLTQPGAALTSSPVPTPTLLATSPSQGQTDFPVGPSVLLFFSQPVELEGAADAGAISLTDASGNPVPFTARQDGAAVIVEPTDALAFGSSYQLSLSGLVNVLGQPISFTATDPTGGTGVLGFQTVDVSGGTSTAPILTALSPGAPCALEGGAGGMPGHCAGGQSSDISYQPFTLDGMNPVVARFSQPMLASSMVLGQTCGQGSVRVEQLDSNGQCIAPVPGTLRPVERGFDFVPNAPWSPGQTYLLTLGAGQDPYCVTGGLCSALSPGRSLNATPLSGIADGTLSPQGGGTDVVIPFTGVAPTPAVRLVVSATPYTDTNGDGLVDGAEVPTELNRLGIAITSTGGFIDSSSQLLGSPCDAASPVGSACQYLQQDLPISVGAAVASCPVDSTGNPTSHGGPCVPVRLSPQTIQLTGLSMSVSTLGGLLNLSNVPTGMLLMRLLEQDASGIVGYIVDDPGTDTTEFVATTSVYVDAPDLVLAGGLATHNLHSYPSTVTLIGPVTFLADGRLQVASTNAADVSLDVQSSALGLTGDMVLTVPAGELRLTLAGEPIK